MARKNVGEGLRSGVLSSGVVDAVESCWNITL